jgi:hypothetical protein
VCALQEHEGEIAAEFRTVPQTSALSISGVVSLDALVLDDPSRSTNQLAWWPRTACDWRAAPVSSTRDRCSGQAHSEVMVFVRPGRGAARGRRTLPALTVQGVVEIVLTERLLKE